MRLAIFLGLVVLEALSFYGIAQLIGVGWAILALIGWMVLGTLLGFSQMVSVAKAASRGQRGGLTTANDIGLLMAGTALEAIPGFLTGLAGLIVIFPPTRAVLRGFAAGKLTQRIEVMGARMYEHSPMAQRSTRFGSFTGEVIDDDGRF
ncbi:FxsA family protein [Corynebacterium uterequi]|uniref:Protein affecting phage T7 exclusion by the F plasmid n=1 Tax=Corynebacterium uterequi TaxID=1072256 RepID=A0A0G3HIT4_9CORY|nr:FxsA family protein [Corynebacterium uterequi]AKK11072.1 protein affecting phage T7 exclusion by the F plasmid [Corynebacterium uterequi]